MLSIGYAYLHHINTLYKDEDIKLLAVEGIFPDANGIRGEVYPLASYYYGVVRSGAPNQVGEKFLHWILSEEGQRCIEQAGYLPLR